MNLCSASRRLLEFDLRCRGRATTGRSRLVAAPPGFQAKNRFFMCYLCGNLMAKNAIFELWPK